MENNRIDTQLLQRYLEGSLDPAQMHRLEREALDDPFLADALDGYGHTQKPIGHQLSILQRQLEERIAVSQDTKNKFNFSSQRLSIAACAGLLFITAGILFWMRMPKDDRLVKGSAPASAPVPEEATAAVASADSAIFPNESVLSKTPRIAARKRPVAAMRLSDDRPIDTVVQTTAEPVGSAEDKDPSAFESFVVSGGAVSDSARAISSAKTQRPLTGKEVFYETYLRNNVRQPEGQPEVRGTVIVEAEISTGGIIASVRIVKGLTDACNAEAIRLVKEGPPWKPEATGKNVQIAVSFGVPKGN